MAMSNDSKRRERMVIEQLQGRGVHNKKVLNAMNSVCREAFVPDELRDFAYADRPLPISAGQTISQPYIVGFMIEALLLDGGEKVLEVGAGSGYAAAVLAEIAGEVFAIERIEELAIAASECLVEQGYRNVSVMHADGAQGCIEHAPFEAILVSAAAAVIPEPLKSQLADGGRMVIPVGGHARGQKLVRITRTGRRQFDYEELADVRFVPLISQDASEK